MKKRPGIFTALILLLLTVSCGRAKPIVSPATPTLTPIIPTAMSVLSTVPPPPTNTPTRIASSTSSPNSFLPISDSTDGLIAFLSDREANNTELYVTSAQHASAGVNDDGDGPRRLIPAGDGFIVGPSWSPDGQRIAYTRIVPNELGRLDNHGPFEVWITTLDGNEHVNISGDITDQILALPWPTPAWSPDGSRLAFIAARRMDGGDLLSSVYVAFADGSGTQWSLSFPWLVFDVIWSPAGDELLLVSFDENIGSSSIYTLSIENQVLTEIYQGAQAASWSPDGSEIVISSYNPPRYPGCWLRAGTAHYRSN